MNSYLCDHNSSTLRRDERTDRQRVRWTCRGNSALRVASRGKNNALNIGYSIKIRLSVNNVTNHNTFTQQINRLFMLNRHVFCGMIADKFRRQNISLCSAIWPIYNSEFRPAGGSRRPWKNTVINNASNDFGAVWNAYAKSLLNVYSILWTSVQRNCRFTSVQLIAEYYFDTIDRAIGCTCNKQLHTSNHYAD